MRTCIVASFVVKLEKLHTCSLDIFLCWLYKGFKRRTIHFQRAYELTNRYLLWEMMCVCNPVVWTKLVQVNSLSFLIGAVIYCVLFF